MRNKLTLLEDENMPVEEIIEPVQQDEHEALMAVNSMISNLIQNKWQAIDLINGNITALQQYDRPDVIAVLNDMISDNYVHIGQLEKVLEMGNPGANNIEAGKADVEDVVDATSNLDDIEVDVDPIEDEVEESLDEDKKGFLKTYKSGKIHDAGDCYVATDKHGKTLGQSKTVAGAESYIDELPADDVDESLADKVNFKKPEVAR